MWVGQDDCNIFSHLTENYYSSIFSNYLSGDIKMSNQLCDYGCGQIAIYQFKNGKRCCSKNTNACPAIQQKIGQSNKGKVRSLEVRLEQSNKMKGTTVYWKNKNRSKETKTKISKSLKGKMIGNTNGFKKGNKPWHTGTKGLLKANKTSFKKGRYRSKEEIEKAKNNHNGELHWNWKGGISCEPYCEQWSDKEYKESIKERDGYKCLNPECDKNNHILCIHHIDYNKKNCHPLNLITVCISCNAKANYNRKWHKSWYQAIIERRYK
jgi:hypothetical protein